VDDLEPVARLRALRARLAAAETAATEELQTSRSTLRQYLTETRHAVHASGQRQLLNDVMTVGSDMAGAHGDLGESVIDALRAEADAIRILLARIDQLAEASYDQWRQERRRPDGSVEPTSTTTMDQYWTFAHGTDVVDLANTRFRDLPDDVKDVHRGNAMAVLRAMDQILEADPAAQARGLEHPGDVAGAELGADRLEPPSEQ
jgi:hypothetical protein